MSETTNLKLFKHDNPSTNTNQFDVDKALNQNWDKLDNFAGEVNDKVIEIKDNTEELQQKTGQIEENILSIEKGQTNQSTEIKNLQQEVQELEQDVKANALEEETEQAKSLKITEASGARGKLKVFGNDEQETRNGYNFFNGKLFSNQTEAGATQTIQNDGTITISGTGKTTGVYNGVASNTKVPLNLKAGTLHIKMDKQTRPGVYVALYNQTERISDTISNFNGAVDTTINITEEMINNGIFLNQYIYSTADVTIIPNDVKVMIYQDGDGTYEEYGASPSLDYPSAIKCLGSNINLYPGWEKNTISSETGKPEIDPNYIRSVDFISVLPNKNYTIKTYNIKEFGDLNTAIRMYDINKNYLSSKWIGSIINNSITFTLTNADVRYIKIVCSNNNTVTNTAKVDIKLEEGEVATTYSPFEQGSTEIRHFNTNFLNTENTNKIISGVKIESNTDKSLKITGTATADGYESIYNKITLPFVLKQGTKVYLNFGKDKQLLKDTNVKPFAWFYSEDSTNTGNINKSGSYVATVSKDTTMLTFGIENIVNAKVYDENMYIVLSTENVEEYVENKNDSYILNIQQEMLRGDYFDLERKKEVHNWNEKIWNGTENWTVDSQNTNDTYISFKTQIDDMISLNSQNTQLIADKIINEYGGIALNKEHLWVYGIYIEVCVKKERLETLDATGFKKLLAQNNINIFYKLATRTELDLTESQIEVLEKLNKLRFHEGTNNILTTEDIALLQAIYPVNLKNVNNKMQEEIDEIKELLSTTQTSAILLDNLEKDLIEEVK